MKDHQNEKESLVSVLPLKLHGTAGHEKTAGHKNPAPWKREHGQLSWRTMRTWSTLRIKCYSCCFVSFRYSSRSGSASCKPSGLEDASQSVGFLTYKTVLLPCIPCSCGEDWQRRCAAGASDSTLPAGSTGSQRAYAFLTTSISIQSPPCFQRHGSHKKAWNF